MGGETGAQKTQDKQLQATLAEQQQQLEQQNKRVQQQRILSLRRSLGGGGTAGAATTFEGLPSGATPPRLSRGLALGLGFAAATGAFRRSSFLG